jgi:hypothetical protein
MIGLLVNLLILCLIIGVLYWIAQLISGMMPPPLQKVPIILVAIVALILILNMLGVAGQPVFHTKAWVG